mmetsp:Transcript_25846/g.55611  ORF Transcript_25846/g.55611 Transcript_25846/m.55611 type:complete len:115 (-) Transcript_25846:409-753(-)|eukprot:CAMPEP_0172299854 /NCGR_PEP_ID=MMETSP1058-20130122/2051_1 /TAXON_ID=83371 /ORGANISM="Detonula confervacea, Strain CCMP 353" /LENGTH=114 /DNA_ID=CAMNT_0013009425 /DNA_START=128 /DNA_END=472 /DNA_ORIENTATION=-
MSCAAVYAPVRKAIAQILLAPGLDGILCPLDKVVVPLDVLRSSVSNDALATIDHTILVAAFRSDENEYILPYTSFGISSEGGNEHYLLVRNAMTVGKYTAVYQEVPSCSFHHGR